MNRLIIRHLPLTSYQIIWQAMRNFTDRRHQETLDEIWLLEHPPVFTQGQAGKPEHVLNTKHIPLIQTDRGGQVTYHGPGQLMLYTLLDIQRMQMSPRQLVTTLEQTIIALLAELGILAKNNAKAPGVYVDQAKICSIGLRIRRGFSYHGLALNVAMDLIPFTYINPCGFHNLKMTQIQEFCPTISTNEIKNKIIPYFMDYFGYTEQHCIPMSEVLTETLANPRVDGAKMQTKVENRYIKNEAF